MIPGKKYLHGTSAPVLPDASNLTTQSSVVRLDAPCHTVLQQFFYHRNILHIGICSTTRTGTFYKYTESRMETSYFEYSDNHLMLFVLSFSFWPRIFHSLITTPTSFVYLSHNSSRLLPAVLFPVAPGRKRFFFPSYVNNHYTFLIHSPKS